MTRELNRYDCDCMIRTIGQEFRIQNFLSNNAAAGD